MRGLARPVEHLLWGRAQNLYALRNKFRDRQGSLHANHLLGGTTNFNFQARCFWGLDLAFNKVDEERVRLAGPDRAAAEWILRNEGSLKWNDSVKYLKDYNMLPSTNFEGYKIEEIDLTATNVIGIGFEHLANLKHVRSIKLHGCRSIGNDALSHLHFVQDTLEFLEVSSCPMITEKGLQELHILKNLKNLLIYDLIEIRHFDKAISNLCKSMPWCQINTDEPLDKTDEEKEIT